MKTIFTFLHKNNRSHLRFNFTALFLQAVCPRSHLCFPVHPSGLPRLTVISKLQLYSVILGLQRLDDRLQIIPVFA
jgi:hypothetical protein